MNNSLVLLFAFIVLFVSCSKDRRPIISIKKPGNGDLVNAATEVEIHVEIWDSDQLTGAALYVTKENSTNDTIIKFTDGPRTDQKYKLTKRFITESNTKYKILIKAWGHGNLATDSIYISSN
ncbi:MAG TPA: hypothetical protein VF008_10865 [Niastella sp.]